MEVLQIKPPVLDQQQQGQPPHVVPRFELIEGGGELTPPTGFLEHDSPQESYLLGDVYDLARYRQEDGSYAPEAEASVLQNKVTAVQEGAIPKAISEVKHQWLSKPEGVGGVIMDLGRTAVETAMRGKFFYKSSEAKARCDVEIEQARHKQETLRPGIAQIFIEPKMTRKDAPLEVAKSEGLAETDSIQVGWLKRGENGQPEEAVTNCMLAPNVPIEAWVDMLEDENNIFGKSIEVEDPQSALSVMKTFKELEVPTEKLPEGPLTILAEVAEYIEDPVAQQKVRTHIEEVRASDQQELKELATRPAERWLEFDKSTEQSLRDGYANNHIKGFIDSLDGSWNDKDQETVDRHKIIDDEGAGYMMTRELAEIIQKAEENLVLTTAAVMVKNEKITSQIEPEVVEIIRANEVVVQQAQMANSQIYFLEMNQFNMNRTIARQKVKVGGGCSGENNAFGNDQTDVSFTNETEMEWGISLNSNRTRGKRDKRGALKFKCANGHWNTRPEGKLIEQCVVKSCKNSVGC